MFHSILFIMTDYLVSIRKMKRVGVCGGVKRCHIHHSPDFSDRFLMNREFGIRDFVVEEGGFAASSTTYYFFFPLSRVRSHNVVPQKS